VKKRVTGKVDSNAKTRLSQDSPKELQEMAAISDESLLEINRQMETDKEFARFVKKELGKQKKFSASIIS